MVDNISPAERSDIMRRVRSKDTKPELRVRRLVHGLGYRYRLHKADLPGRPDLVFASRRKVIFVHGCFWHGHSCKLGRVPKSRVQYWLNKLKRNRERDKLVLQRLKAENWRSLVIWECQLRNLDKLVPMIIRFLER